MLEPFPKVIGTDTRLIGAPFFLASIAHEVVLLDLAHNAVIVAGLGIKNPADPAPTTSPNFRYRFF